MTPITATRTKNVATSIGASGIFNEKRDAYLASDGSNIFLLFKQTVKKFNRDFVETADLTPLITTHVKPFRMNYAASTLFVVGHDATSGSWGVFKFDSAGTFLGKLNYPSDFNVESVVKYDGSLGLIGKRKYDSTLRLIYINGSGNITKEQVLSVSGSVASPSEINYIGDNIFIASPANSGQIIPIDATTLAEGVAVDLNDPVSTVAYANCWADNALISWTGDFFEEYDLGGVGKPVSGGSVDMDDREAGTPQQQGTKVDITTLDQSEAEVHAILRSYDAETGVLFSEKGIGGGSNVGGTTSLPFETPTIRESVPENDPAYITETKTGDTFEIMAKSSGTQGLNYFWAMGDSRTARFKASIKYYSDTHLASKFYSELDLFVLGVDSGVTPEGNKDSWRYTRPMQINHLGYKSYGFSFWHQTDVNQDWVNPFRDDSRADIGYIPTIGDTSGQKAPPNNTVDFIDVEVFIEVREVTVYVELTTPVGKVVYVAENHELLGKDLYFGLHTHNYNNTSTISIKNPVLEVGVYNGPQTNYPQVKRLRYQANPTHDTVDRHCQITDQGWELYDASVSTGYSSAKFFWEATDFLNRGVGFSASSIRFPKEMFDNDFTDAGLCFFLAEEDVTLGEPDFLEQNWWYGRPDNSVLAMLRIVEDLDPTADGVQVRTAIGGSLSSHTSHRAPTGFNFTGTRGFKIQFNPVGLTSVNVVIYRDGVEVSNLQINFPLKSGVKYYFGLAAWNNSKTGVSNQDMRFVINEPIPSFAEEDVLDVSDSGVVTYNYEIPDGETQQLLDPVAGQLEVVEVTSDKVVVFSNTGDSTRKSVCITTNVDKPTSDKPLIFEATIKPPKGFTGSSIYTAMVVGMLRSNPQTVTAYDSYNARFGTPSWVSDTDKDFQKEFTGIKFKVPINSGPSNDRFFNSVNFKGSHKSPLEIETWLEPPYITQDEDAYRIRFEIAPNATDPSKIDLTAVINGESGTHTISKSGIMDDSYETNLLLQFFTQGESETSWELSDIVWPDGTSVEYPSTDLDLYVPTNKPYYITAHLPDLSLMGAKSYNELTITDTINLNDSPKSAAGSTTLKSQGNVVNGANQKVRANVRFYGSSTGELINNNVSGTSGFIGDAPTGEPWYGVAIDGNNKIDYQLFSADANTDHTYVIGDSVDNVEVIFSDPVPVNGLVPLHTSEIWVFDPSGSVFLKTGYTSQSTQSYPKATAINGEIGLEKAITRFDQTLYVRVS